MVEDLKKEWKILNGHLEKIKFKIEEFLYNKNVTSKNNESSFYQEQIKKLQEEIEKERE